MEAKMKHKLRVLKQPLAFSNEQKLLLKIAFTFFNKKYILTPDGATRIYFNLKILPLTVCVYN